MGLELDIHEQIEALAQMTGVEHNAIQKIVYEPHQVAITRLLRDENGSFYLVADKEGREDAASEELVFRVARS